MTLKKYMVSLLIFFAYTTISCSETKIACIGDSITAGFGIKGEKRKTHCYPSQLQRLLGDSYEVKNFGASGRTLLRDESKAWIKTGHYKKVKDYKPDVVVFKLGTNDSKMAHWINKDKMEGDLLKFIAEFREWNPKVKIYLCTPAACFNLKEGHAGICGLRIRDGIIPVIKKVVKENELFYIDLFTPLSDKSDYFPDRVHPNESGAEAIAKLVYTALIK